jgi:integrase
VFSSSSVFGRLGPFRCRVDAEFKLGKICNLACLVEPNLANVAEALSPRLAAEPVLKMSGRQSAKRSRRTLSALFSWASREGLTETNPVTATNDPGKGLPSRDRVLDDDEIRIVWRACGDDNFGRVVKLLLLTGCRRSEIGELRWSEIDLDAGVLTIPGTRTKNHRTLTLILPEIAIDECA